MANVTTEELDLRLVEFAEGLGLSVYEFVNGGYVNLTNYTLDMAAINARLNAIDIFNESDGVETVVERLEALRNVFENGDGDLITTVINDIAQNKSDIVAEVARATAAEATLAGRATALETATSANAAAIAAEVTRATGVEAGLRTDVTAVTAQVATNTANIAVLKGNDTVVGSVASAVKAEADRTKAVTGNLNDLTTTAKSNLVAAINELVSTGSTSAANVAALVAELDAVEASVGLNSDGSFTAEDGSDSLYSYITNLGGDADSIKKQIRKLAKNAKAADVALSGRIDALEVKKATDVANLQSQINSLSGGASGSIGDIAGRVTAVENTLNDTVDGNGVPVKGLVTKVSEVTSALATEVSDRVAGDASTLAAAKAYADGKFLGVPEIQALNICGAVNAFRAKLNQTPNNCAGGVTPPPAGGGDEGL